MLAFPGVGLIVAALALVFALAPRAGKEAQRKSWIDACAAVACTTAIMTGLALIIAGASGW